MDDMFLERCTIAANKEDFVLPCCSVDCIDVRIPSRLSKLAPADFSGSWIVGLDQVMSRLRALGIKPELDLDRGRQIALRDYMPMRVTVAKPEPVFANVFPLLLPKTMLVFEFRGALTHIDLLDLRKHWAFVKLSSYRFLAFEPPSQQAISSEKFNCISEFAWEHIQYKEGKKTCDLAKELVVKSLQIACVRKGLRFCSRKNILYFPKRETSEWVQPIKHVDGRSTTVQLTGERTKGWGDHASLFSYQLAPRFSPQYDNDGNWNVVVKIYIRVTTPEGDLFDSKEIGRRRKVVSKNWWNKDWLARLLGVVQALQTSDGRIEVGEGPRTVVMQTRPLSWECPVGLDVMALSGMPDLGEEMAQFRALNAEQDDDD
jgi:hypothetical protein